MSKSVRGFAVGLMLTAAVGMFGACQTKGSEAPKATPEITKEVEETKEPETTKEAEPTVAPTEAPKPTEEPKPTEAPKAIPDKSELTRKRTTNFYCFEEAEDFYVATKEVDGETVTLTRAADPFDRIDKDFKLTLKKMQLEPVMSINACLSEEDAVKLAEYYSSYPGVISLAMRKRIGYQDTILYNVILQFEPCLYAWETGDMDFLSKRQKEEYDAIQPILAEVAKLETDYEKELYLYDWLLENVTWNERVNFDEWMAYYPLVQKASNGVAVTRAFSILLSMSGIENCYIDSNPDSVVGIDVYLDTNPLVWLEVLIDGEWYNVNIDIELIIKNRPIAGMLELPYLLFNLPDEEYDMNQYYLNGDRKYKYSIVSTNYPVCEATEYCYSVHDGLWIRTPEELRALFDEKWDADENHFIFCYPLEPDALYDIVQDFGYGVGADILWVPGGSFAEFVFQVQEY